MKKILIILILLFPSLLFSQQKTEGDGGSKKFPYQSVRTDKLKLKALSFNKIIPDPRGEILEVEFKLHNMTDSPQNLYIFVIATFEKSFKTTSSFQSPSLEDKDHMKLFIPFPENIKNFEYAMKDSSGKDKIQYIKYPKNIKAGINPATGKMYTLDETLTFRSRHLTRYLKQFNFFNEIAVLIFDENENLMYRQLYKVRGKQR